MAADSGCGSVCCGRAANPGRALPAGAPALSAGDLASGSDVGCVRGSAVGRRPLALASALAAARAARARLMPSFEPPRSDTGDHPVRDTEPGAGQPGRDVLGDRSRDQDLLSIGHQRG